MYYFILPVSIIAAGSHRSKRETYDRIVLKRKTYRVFMQVQNIRSVKLWSSTQQLHLKLSWQWISTGSLGLNAVEMSAVILEEVFSGVIRMFIKYFLLKKNVTKDFTQFSNDQSGNQIIRNNKTNMFNFFLSIKRKSVWLPPVSPTKQKTRSEWETISLIAH